MRCAGFLGLSILVASPALGQSEQALREAFEGKTVKIKIDMPATSVGIDVRPGQKPPINFTRLGELLKREGTSVRAGESILVTKVKVKKALVEFHLGGGGYGTFGDMVNSSPSSEAPGLGKSAREKQLEDQIRASTDPAKKKALERELRDERHRRQSENARAQAEANQANQLRESNIRQDKLRSGSRFNLRFKDTIPPEYLTPEGLQKALAPWVDFGEPTAPVAGDEVLRKGLLLVEVERLLGPAVAAGEKREGSLVVQERTYRRGEERISTKFVNGVLIEYAISSN